MAKKIEDLSLEEKDEILSFLAMDDFDNFKDTFSKKFFTKESAVANDDIQKTIIGKRMTEVSSKIHKIAKFLNPEITLNEFTKKPVEENISELETLLTTRFADYDTKLKSGNDKRANDLEILLGEKDKSLIAYKELAEKEAAEKARIENEYQTGMKSYKIKHQYDELKSKLNWIDEPTDVQRIGFDTKISTTYKFDLDENEKLQIFTSDMKPIHSKTKAGQMADPLEVLDAELDVNKLKKNNNAKQGNVTKFVTTTQESGRQIPPDSQRRMKELQK